VKIGQQPNLPGTEYERTAELKGFEGSFLGRIDERGDVAKDEFVELFAKAADGLVLGLAGNDLAVGGTVAGGEAGEETEAGVFAEQGAVPLVVVGVAWLGDGFVGVALGEGDEGASGLDVEVIADVLGDGP
jgi:hypothetical protein